MSKEVKVALISLIGVIATAVIAGIFVLYKPSSTSKNSSNQTVTIDGSNNTVTQTIGLTDKGIALITKPYIEKIKELEYKLEHAKTLPERLELSSQLEKANLEKKKKDQQIKELQEVIQNSTIKIVKEATEILNQEGIEKALKFLHIEKIENLKSMTDKNMKELSQTYLFEANLLQLQNRYKETEEAFEEAVKYDNSVEVLSKFAYFLQKQNNFQKSETLYNRILEIIKKNPDTNISDIAMIFNNSAGLYSKQNRPKEAEDSYDEALKLKRALAKKNPDAYTPDVAMTLNNLGNFYRSQDRSEEAEGSYNEALKLRRALVKKNPDTYIPDVATTLNSLAIFYSNQKRPEDAEASFNEALKLRRALVKKNPDAYNSILADTLNNLAYFYSNQKRPEDAEVSFNEALKLYRALIKKNPDAFTPYLAITLNNLGNVYLSQERPEEAEDSYDEALKLKRVLAKKNPDAYTPDVAMTLINLGNAYRSQKRPEDAEDSYNEALKFYRALIKKNPDAYTPYLAITLSNLAIFYSNQERPEDAEDSYNESLKLYRALAKKNPRKYDIKYAKMLIKGVYYYKRSNSDLEIAETLLEKYRGIPQAEKLLEFINNMRK